MPAFVDMLPKRRFDGASWIALLVQCGQDTGWPIVHEHKRYGSCMVLLREIRLA
jgi:hypothetical protein